MIKHTQLNRTIDLNADLGEGGAFDTELLQIVSSASIACGGHTGDKQSMVLAVTQAMLNSVTIGAHPSFPDPDNFGRQPMNITNELLEESVYQQIMSLQAICNELGATMFHVKPHGALYNLAASNAALGQMLIKVINRIDPQLKLMALAGSPLVQQAKQAGITVIEEGFADRAYMMDGTLAPRELTGAVITHDKLALTQVEQFVDRAPINTLDSTCLVINVDSICLHGDNQHALTLAKKIKARLLQLDITIAS